MLKELTQLYKSVLPLFIICFLIFSNNILAQDQSELELENDEELVEQDFSLQLDGRFMADTFFSEITEGAPSVNLNESFISLSASYRERIKLVLIANLGHLVENGEVALNENIDIEKFIRDAYIELRNINDIPVAIIIGKHPITFGQNIQEMPGWANGPLRNLQEIREVYGVTITLTRSILGAFDQIDYSIFEQESGDLSLGKLNGHNLRLTKYLNEQLLLTIGLQQKENLDQTKNRQARVGLVGMDKSGKFIGWAEGMIFSNDPNYPESNFALTMGASYQFIKNTKVVVEFNLLEKELIQLGLGVKTTINKSLTAGVDVRFGQNLQSGELEYFLGLNLSYSFNFGTKNNLDEELLLFEDELESIEEDY
jgi:hypothetical protein